MNSQNIAITCKCPIILENYLETYNYSNFDKNKFIQDIKHFLNSKQLEIPEYHNDNLNIDYVQLQTLSDKNKHF
jgi:hypothetical protein